MAEANQFRIGRLSNLGQVVRALGKTIRAMANGSLDSQVGARICNSLGIMRAAMETQHLDAIAARLDTVEQKTGETSEIAAFQDSDSGRKAFDRVN